ncbi:hypothetical protein [Foetidibacter luteolus]|nr:hypothetical protein [Foetidibacter luteolus]
MTVEKKKRSDKYDKKLSVSGSFADVIAASVKNIKVEQKEKQPKKAAKKK